MRDFDLASIYRTARHRLLALAPTLDPGQLATTVPTCPDWTVQDTYAHLTGLAADALAGRTGIGSADSTARQVEERGGRSIGEVCDEWEANGAAMESFVADNAANALAIDAWTHDQDIHNALGIVSGRDGPGLDLTVSGVWRLKRQIREAGLPTLRIVAGDRDWLVGDTAPGTTLHVDPYELARAVLGRRSRNQMLAFDWNGDPEPYVDKIPVWTPTAADILE